jgi:hypothetical protein
VVAHHLVRLRRWASVIAAAFLVAGLTTVTAALVDQLPASASELPCSSSTAISYGAPALTGAIVSSVQAACFTFPVTDGDHVRFNVRAVSGGISPFTDVFDAGGVSKCATPGDIVCTADSTGTWVVQISASATGTFNIFDQRLDGPVGCKPITFGAPPLTGKIAAAADAACFTFSGSSGDVVFGKDQNLVGSGAAFTELDSPDGSQVCFTEGGGFTCTLTQTGTQTVLAYYSGTQTGSFSMYVQRMTGPAGCSALKFGASAISAKIKSIGAVDCFTYSGPVGALATVDPVVVKGMLSPETDDFSPAGVSKCATPGELSCTIDSAGTWTTLIYDTNGTRTGTFTISAVDLGVSPLTGPSGTSVSLSGAGFQSGETVKVKYETNLASPTSVVVCTGAASGSGSFSCSGTVPTADAGPLGLHVVQAKGMTSGHKTKGTFTLT